MNILIFNWRDIRHEWAGGGELYIHEIAKRWVQAGNRVTLFCGQDVRKKLPDEEDIDGVHIIRKGGRFTVYLWAAWFYLTRLRHACDAVVDVQNGMPFFTVLYSYKPKIAVVYHIHGQQFFIELPFPYNIVGYTIERYLFPLLYRNTPIQVISKATKNDLVERGIPPSHIRVIYCGIEAPVKKTGPIKKFVTPTILYLGRIKKYKRVELLVHIMPEILRRVPQARLLIAGWGTDASTVTDASMRSALRKRIRIVGPVTESEKRDLLTKSWVFVNPSINEGWGISVIEANVYGTPAVAFNVPGLSESIQDKKTGLLAQDNRGLVQNITLILTNRRLRTALSRAALAWSETFSWDKASKESMKYIHNL